MHPVPRQQHSNLDLSVGVSEIVTELKCVCGILCWEYQSSENTHRKKGIKSKNKPKQNRETQTKNYHQIGIGKQEKTKTKQKQQQFKKKKKSRLLVVQWLQLILKSLNSSLTW